MGRTVCSWTGFYLLAMIRGNVLMAKKILVTYATRAGSTAEIAEKIGRVLISRGFTVDVLPVKNAGDLKCYDAVVIGSGIRFGQWMPEAAKFVEQNQSILSLIPTAYFSVHLLNIDEEEASQKARASYLDSVRKIAAPRAEAYFAGVGDMNKISLIERLISRAVKSPVGDLRDWKVIERWAETLPETLS
jgi:menaquinone-dependent protoporphyrinogen oxidase